MPARFPSLSRFVFVGAVLLAACKSDTSTTPNLTVDPIPTPSGPLKLGDVVSVNVNGDSACRAPVLHPAKVVAIGSKALILNDTLNPRGFTDADFQRFAARFDTLVYPLDVANFGDPTDIDKNGRIIILFTRSVNELTEARSNSYVGGFAFSRDLFTKEATARTQACPASNQGEYFYLLTPDPQGTINQNVRSVGFVDSVTTSVLAHEFEHLINASRRLYVNTSSKGFETRWLDEGLAHIAEELLFYREAKLDTRMNLDLAAIRASNTARLAFNADMSGNAGRYRSFLQAPSTNSPYSSFDSLPTRGATWSFLRYSADRINATDGFAAGPAQTVTGQGTVTLSPGASVGEYIATVANTSQVQDALTSFTLVPSGITAPSPNQFGAGNPLAQRAAFTVGAELQPDARFESRLRQREQFELTARIPATRAWYAAQGASMMAGSLSRFTGGASAADGTLWFRLVNSDTTGFGNLQRVFGTDITPFVRDWLVSNAVDDIAAPATEYQQRSWNWHSIYPALGGGTYPLVIQTISSSASIASSVVSGGAAYYRFAVPANGTATVTLGVAGGAASSSLHLLIVRTK